MLGKVLGALLLASCAQVAGAALQWEPLGGPEGGNINALVQSGTTLYAANGATGVFRSTDGGATWSDPGNAGLPSRSVIALAVAPDGSLLASIELSVYRSTDGGANWLRSDSGMVLSNNGSDHVSQLTRIGTRVWALGGDDLFVSTDNGQTWTSSHTGVTGFFNLYSHITADSAGNLYVRISDQSFNSRIYVSTDGGANWTQRTNGLPTTSFSAGFTGLAAHPSNGEVYVGFTNLFGSGPNDGVWKTVDQGASWTQVANEDLPGTTNGAVLIDPAATRLVFLSPTLISGDLSVFEFGTNAVRTLRFAFTDIADAESARSGLFQADGRLLLGTASEGVYQSDAGLTTFSPLRAGMTGGRSDSIAGRVTGGATELVVSRAVPNVQLVGLGNARSDDGGAAWTQVGPENTAGKEIGTNTLFVTRAGTYLALVGGGAFATGELRRSTDGGQTWPVVAGQGFNSSTAHAKSNPAWAQDSQGRIYVFTGPGSEFIGLRRSVDDGLTFTALTHPAGSGFYSMAVAPDDTLYVVSTGGNGKVLSRTNDGGATWTILANNSTHATRLVRASDSMDCSASIESVAVTSDGALFAFACQRVFRSTDRGASFTDQSNGLTQVLGGFIVSKLTLTGSIHALPGNLLALDTDGSDLFTSTDCGATWAEDGAGLPNLGRIDPDDADGGVRAQRSVARVYSPGDGCIYGAPIDERSLLPGTGTLHRARLPAQGMSCGGPIANPVLAVPATGSCGAGGPVTDTTPDAFQFVDQTGVAQGAAITSNTITIAGIDTPSPVSVSGGQYSIGCAANAFTATPTNISAGQTVCVRHTSANAAGTAVNTTLTVGGVSDTFTSTTAAAPVPDTTPDPFAFSDQVNVPLGSVREASVTIGGINQAAPVSVAGGEYSVGCTGTFTTQPGTVANGQQVCVRHTAASANGASVDTTLTVGGVSDTFTSTTVTNVPPAGPNRFQLIDQANTCFFRDAVSAPVTLSGLTGTAAVSITGGEYSLNNGPFTSQNGTAQDGDVIVVTHVTAQTPNTATNTVLTVNNVSDTFTSTTAADNVNCGGNTGGNGNTVTDAQGRPVTFTASQGTITGLVRNNAGPNTAPGGFSYPFGFFSFNVDLPAGVTQTTVTITLPPGTTADEVIKCIGLNCAVYPSDIDGNVVTVTLTDGGAGDADGVVDGRIVDPIAPALAQQTLTSTGGSFGGAWIALAGMLAALRRRRALLGALGLVAGAASAGTPYAGVRGGVAQTSQDSARLTNALRAEGHAVRATVDQRDASGSLYAGYAFTPAFALEAGYVRLGEFDASVTGTSTDPAGLRDDFVRLRPVSGDAVSVAGRWLAPLAGDWLRLATRLGGFAWFGSTDVNGQEQDENGIGALVGLAFDVRLAQHFSVAVGAELLRLSSEESQRQLYGQIEYRF